MHKVGRRIVQCPQCGSRNISFDMLLADAYMFTCECNHTFNVKATKSVTRCFYAIEQGNVHPQMQFISEIRKLKHREVKQCR